MRKSKEIRRFEKWCFGRFGLRPIRIRHINAPCLITPDGQHSFGCYSFGDGKAEIYLACKLPKSALLAVVSHEISHHYQNEYGEIYAMEPIECEEHAEKTGMKLLSIWKSRNKSKKRKPGTKHPRLPQ